ncbi:MAG: hypothetical protein OEM97_11520 [Acidimicrobiia bacterium]|nr:hypothetical protein [Acidimicrobiia bacterium]
MGTDKRDRQRQNRAEKQAQEAAAARKARLKSRIRKGAIWVTIVAVVLVLANLVWGGGNADAAVMAVVS